MARVKCPRCFHVNPDQQDHCQKCNTALPRIRIEARSVINDAPQPQPGNKSPQFRRGQVVAGRYTVLNLVGQGGMGCIYKVHDNTLGEDVALKTLLPQFLDDKIVLERFYNEAKIARRLAHQNIVRVHDIGEDGKVLYISMEFLQGMSLREVIDNLKPGERLPIAQTLRIFDELCAALEYAHQFTIHRDIKPENVMLGQDGVVRLMDFGISKLMSNTRLTGASVVMGTPFYMSPEQIRNSRDVDARSDIYSVGVMLYEILTGSVPTGIPKPASQLISDVPPAMDKIVVKCVDPNPKERYQNATELRQAFYPIREMLKSGVSIPKQALKPGRFQAYSMKKIGGALAGLLVIFGGFWGLAQAEKQRKAVAAAPPVVLVEEGEPETPIVQAPTFASYEDLKDKLRQRAEPYAGSTGVADAVLEGDRFWDLAVENSLENEPEAIRLAGYAFQCYYAALRHHDLPNDMIFVPPGPVFMPGGQELFVGAYFIDRSEVSLGRYRDFVRREADFDLPPRFEGYSADYDSYPICDVTGVEAMAFAAATGAMLPTDAQWSRAASYSDDDEKSWPNPPTQIGSSPRYNVDYATDFPQPIQAFSNDRSYFGCYDIVGNVSEWTRSSSDENPGFGSMMVVRGGDFSRPFVSPEDARFSMRFDYRAETVGFRCVIEIPSTPAAIAYQLDQ